MRYFLVLLLIFNISFLALSEDEKFVQISIPVACMRATPSHSAELVSQAILGTPMMVMDQEGEWWKLKGPDGYEGFVNQSSFIPLTPEEFDNWRSSSRLRVSTLDEAVVYNSPTSHLDHNVVTRLVNGSIIVEESNLSDDFIGIVMPDGRNGFIERKNVVKIDTISSLAPFKILADCHELMGTPYLWGGCSTKSMDCSGLVRIVFLNQGLLLPRDAKDLYLIGTPVDRNFESGDLLFFSSSSDGNITHVAIYDSDNKYIHCSGMVKMSEMSPEDPDFSRRYFRGARRISPDASTEGFVRITSHPWYFK